MLQAVTNKLYTSQMSFDYHYHYVQGQIIQIYLIKKKNTFNRDVWNHETMEWKHNENQI